MSFRGPHCSTRLFPVDCWAACAVQVGPLSVNFAQGRIVLRGREVSLTLIENELLNVFLTHETIPNQTICLHPDWNGLPIRRRCW